ncbi:MAG: aldose 1-epimerase family protein [Lachnospiraceae bacterium]
MSNTKKMENERLLVEISSMGSQLTRIYDKKYDREILWNADPKVWGRHAPILFPFIGKCFKGQYHYQGETYAISAHGFARDMEFAPAADDDQEVWYRLEDDAQTYEKYPFHFKLETGHRLEGNKLTVLWKVTNTDSRELLFMLGGHPAFMTPPGKTIYDFTLAFEPKKDLHYEAPNESGCADPDRQGILKLQDGKVPVTPGFFDQVLTYIFDENQVDRVSLLVDEEPYVTVHCAGIPYLGIWTEEKTHPFVCLEPWFGRCDDQGYEGELADRPGVMKLEAGAVFQAEYVIEIH